MAARQVQASDELDRVYVVYTVRASSVIVRECVWGEVGWQRSNSRKFVLRPKMRRGHVRCGRLPANSRRPWMRPSHQCCMRVGRGQSGAFPPFMRFGDYCEIRNLQRAAGQHLVCLCDQQRVCAPRQSSSSQFSPTHSAQSFGCHCVASSCSVFPSRGSMKKSGAYPQGTTAVEGEQTGSSALQ